MNSISDAAEFKLVRRLQSLSAQFKHASGADKLLRSALRLALDVFGGTGCAAKVVNEPRILFATPRKSAWDLAVLEAFARGEKLRGRRDQMFARIRRRDRMWGVLSIHRPGVEFRWDARRAFSEIGNTVTEIISQIDRERIREVQARIDRKIMEHLRPKDLCYQILHGLRSLTEYDHSSALLMFDETDGELEVVAEQIAWRKGKSERVGLKLPLTASLHRLLEDSVVYGFHRDDIEWREWSDQDATELADLLDYNFACSTDHHDRIETSMLCAPLVAGERLLGVLKVAAESDSVLGDYEAQLLSRFLPQAAVALQNSQRTEALEHTMLAAERKSAMAGLARGVSHDINNAMGAILPLVQSMQRDVRDGHIDDRVFAEDLTEIEKSLQVCRRIFDGMLRYARSGARSRNTTSNLAKEINVTLDILRDSFQRRGIDVVVDIDDGLPRIIGSPANVEQLLLNIIKNASDAMEQGGHLTISCSLENDRVCLQVTDTGCGIQQGDVDRILEPFVTTKASGNGLGLAICRSIVSQLGGKLSINSVVDEGTTVTIRLRLAPDSEHE